VIQPGVGIVIQPGVYAVIQLRVGTVIQPGVGRKTQTKALSKCLLFDSWSIFNNSTTFWRNLPRFCEFRQLFFLKFPIFCSNWSLSRHCQKV